ncbi:MAG TPA: septal ring lytic transglycosylase RlpA family protein [Patescibacteria group bacterium]|nr:septal ring lytic transglycosylase RlpA family protein [Patescibacteria group bacterium]
MNYEADDAYDDKEEEYHGIPWQLGGLLTLGILTACIGLGGYFASQVKADGAVCPPQMPSRPADLTFAGVYFFPGELDSSPARQEGRANFYGGEENLDEFTGSGEPFNPDALTAASWFYPMGTELQVTDEQNGASVTVRVNDRGPDRVDYPDVIIDLTRGAMAKLDPNAQSARVKITPVCP